MAGFYVEGLSANTANQLSKTIDTNFFSLTPVRVKYTFTNLDQLKTENPDLFKKYGEYFSLGGILFDSISNPTPEGVNELENYIFAQPLFPNLNQVPLINELTYVISLPTPNLQNPNFINLNDSGKFYYFPPVKLWNSNHHNALPNPLTTSTQTPSEQKDYQQVEAGSSQKITNNIENINLGNTFEERADIKPLQPYEGDIIYEGRWGQSLRFGSTVPGTDNTWSEIGNSGDPITILRNGQGEQSGDPWIPMVEDINNLESSAWFTSTQQIPINVASSNYDSYSSYIPTTPNQYAGNQVILNAGRLLFNTTTDHILLSSALTIGFNAVKGFNFDTKANFVINAPSIKLGGKEATEPVLKGDTTIDILSQLVDELTKLTITLQSVTPQGGPLVAPAATQLVPVLQSIKTRLETTTKSKYSKTL